MDADLGIGYNSRAIAVKLLHCGKSNSYSVVLFDFNSMLPGVGSHLKLSVKNNR